MLIDGNDYRVNILVLSMQDEVGATLFTLQTLLRQVEDGVVLSVLLNGGHSEEIRKLSEEHDCLRYYSVDRNLGVAGGRNYLLRTEECRNCDVVLIIDNDVVAPVDYVRGLVTFLLREKGAGVAGGVVADINNFGEPDGRGVAHGEWANLRSGGIKAQILRDLHRDRIYHMGVRKDYAYAYFSILPRCMKVIAYFKVFAALHYLFDVHVNVFPVLRGNAKYQKMIRDGVEKYEVSNVAGCSQAFRRELVDRIGYLDERFSPYGFEDVDFCIRAMRAGYRNYIDTNTWLLHGTDRRHAQRDPLATLVNTYKGRTILGSSLYGSTGKLKAVILRLIIVIFVIDFLKSPVAAIRELRSKFEGYRRGMGVLGCP